MTLPANIADLLSASAARTPDAPAVTDRTATLSYAELATRAGHMADQLSAAGITPGDRVAVIVDKEVAVVAAIFGCFLAGAVLVPVNPQLKALQLGYILSDSGARMLLAGPKRAAILQDIDPNLAKTALLDADLSPVSDAPMPGPRAPAPGFEDLPLATLFYTSGSTGLPKAVACTHANVLAGATSVSTYLENTAQDVILAVLPLSFDAGFSQLTTAFHVGAHVILRDYLLPADIARPCRDHGVTGITGVPAIWAAALRAKWDDTARHNIRYVANTGGHLSYQRICELTDLFPNARPYPMYGLTEAFRSSYLHPDHVHSKQGSMGQAIPGATLVVVDEMGQDCAPDQPGELVHAGPTVAAGYWNNPEETAKRFRPAPPALTARGITGTVVYSGDLVRQDADGFLFYETRMDGQIKISGNRISFAEIEEVALAHPEVRACAAGGRKVDLAQDPELLLFVESDGGEDVAEALMAQLRAELPGFSVPSRIFTRPRLILNANGKYDVKQMIAEHCNTAEHCDTAQGNARGTD